MQVGQCLVNDFAVSSNYFRSTFAVSLFDRFLDVSDRLFARENPSDAEEARLHDRVDAPAHADFSCECVSINCEDPNLFLDYLLLHFTREQIPNSLRFTRRVQQKRCTLCRVFEHVDLVDEFELMTRDETSALDEVSGTYRTRARAQV